MWKIKILLRSLILLRSDAASHCRCRTLLSVSYVIKIWELALPAGRRGSRKNSPPQHTSFVFENGVIRADVYSIRILQKYTAHELYASLSTYFKECSLNLQKANIFIFLSAFLTWKLHENSWNIQEWIFLDIIAETSTKNITFLRSDGYWIHVIHYDLVCIPELLLGTYSNLVPMPTL